MLLVRTKIGPSKIEGTGLFADQFIPKGTPTWRFQEGFDLKFSEKDIMKLPKLTREFMLKYAYRSAASDKYILCCDDSRFCNHSDKPNTDGVYSEENPEGLEFASRDIPKGEEITANYLDFDRDAKKKLMLK